MFGVADRPGVVLIYISTMLLG